MKQFKSYFLSSAFILCLINPVKSSAIEVMFESENKLPLVYLSIALKTGAVADPKDKTGLSQFTGELLLRGSKSKTRKQINQKLDEMGASLGFDTRSEMMILRGVVLSDQISAFLDLITEILTQPRFDQKEINKLKKETLSKILASEGDDMQLAYLHFQKHLFGDHPYAKPIDGLKNHVSSFTKKDIKNQYKRLFLAEGMLIVGSGDAESKLIKTFGKNLKKKLPGKALYPKIRAPKRLTERKVILIDKPNRTQAQVMVGKIGVKLQHPNYFALNLVNHTFGGGGFTTRMFKQIRKEKGWSYSAYSYFKFGTEPRFWLSHFFPKNQDLEVSLSYFLKMLNDLEESGITAQEYEFNKNAIINGSGFKYNTAKKRNENTILEETLHLPPRFMRSYARRTKKVSLKKANHAIKDFLGKSNELILILGTADQLKPQIAKALKIKEKEIEIFPFRL